MGPACGNSNNISEVHNLHWPQPLIKGPVTQLA
jgi:hypothetical protein